MRALMSCDETARHVFAAHDVARQRVRTVRPVGDLHRHLLIGARERLELDDVAVRVAHRPNRARDLVARGLESRERRDVAVLANPTELVGHRLPRRRERPIRGAQVAQLGRLLFGRRELFRDRALLRRHRVVHVGDEREMVSDFGEQHRREPLRDAFVVEVRLAEEEDAFGEVEVETHV